MPPATVNMTIDPTTITLGQSATVTWSSNGTTCEASGAWSGSKAASGSEVVTPGAAGTVTYSMLCSGGAYSQSQAFSVMLTVNPMMGMGFTHTALVSQFAGSAALTTDSRLTSPRGIAVAANAPARVMTSTAATAFDGMGRAQPMSPMASDMAASTNGAGFEPTAIVANATPHFVVTANGRSARAELVVTGKGGMIAAWSAGVDSANAITVFAASDGAVYTGIAMANDGNGDFLYVTDFHNNKIDVFDSRFERQARERFAFADLTLSAGYAPFGILAIENRATRSTQILVSYAQQLAPDARDSAMGAGAGLVNVFDTEGRFLRRLVSTGGALNAPWGMALAPSDFGSLSNTLLIGNSGDGKINAFDPASGQFVGTLSDTAGRPIVIQGLWGMAFGNDTNRQPHNTLFFAASTDQADGAFGRIDAGAMPLTN